MGKFPCSSAPELSGTVRLAQCGGAVSSGYAVTDRSLQNNAPFISGSVLEGIVGSVLSAQRKYLLQRMAFLKPGILAHDHRETDASFCGN